MLWCAGSPLSRYNELTSTLQWTNYKYTSWAVRVGQGPYKNRTMLAKRVYMFDRLTAWIVNETRCGRMQTFGYFPGMKYFPVDLPTSEDPSDAGWGPDLSSLGDLFGFESRWTLKGV